MPNAEPQEHDFPPGLYAPRSSFERFQAPANPFAGISEHPAIAPSLGMPQTSSQPLSSSIPRSLGMFDRDHLPPSNAWAPDGLSKRTPSLPGPQGPHNLAPIFSSHPTSPQPIAGVNSAGAMPFSFDGGAHPFIPSSVPDRDLFASPPRLPQSANNLAGPYPITASAPAPSAAARTLYWGDLEPWMDEEYAKQVISFMKWDATVQIPSTIPETAANNPGYCYLTFQTASIAASVLAHINSKPVSMPNSNKPFSLNWASAVPVPPVSTSPPAQPFAKEYSIFVGDLAPEASNSDLVAVFRNPVLGLRNDREPKFIKPFLSCKSAKIMLDPVTGISRGYGFVRFTDEADQQRALIEMHGLYCLSRPMRISPATAKFKPPPQTFDLPQVQMPSQAISPPPQLVQAPSVFEARHNSLTSAFAVADKSANAGPASAPLPSISAALISLGLKPEDIAGIPPHMLSQIAQAAAASRAPGGPSAPGGAPFNGRQQMPPPEQGRFNTSDETNKYQAQVRAILSSLIGPNGEQLTSTDPYNTTVFVGGLSPLISEETLRTFFAPFGDIHYVKVPAGKHCGFVQFVRKNDAERAIEKMQGFPIGGSRIRLSWGRSQYKAAQAAAQAAQNAALQLSGPNSAPAQPQQPQQQQQQPQFAQTPPQPQVQSPPPVPPNGQAQTQSDNAGGQVVVTPDQAIQILRSLGFTNVVSANNQISIPGQVDDSTLRRLSEENIRALVMSRSSEETNRSFDIYSTSGSSNDRSENGSEEPRMRPQGSMFSPFSPDTSGVPDTARRSSATMLQSSKSSFSVSFSENSMLPKDFAGGMVSPGSGIPQHTTRPSSGSFSQRLSPFLTDSINPPTNVAISRPPSSKRASPPRSTAVPADIREQEAIEDVNGTLASLDLGQDAGDASA